MMALEYEALFEARSSRRVLTLGILAGAVCFLFGYVSPPMLEGSSHSLSSLSSDSTATLEQVKTTKQQPSTLNMVAYNYYTKIQPVSAYPWKFMGEPYRTTTLEVVDASDDFKYTWEVDGHVQGFGSAVDVMFTDLGMHDVKLTAQSDDVSLEKSIQLMVKYVRREIRSLTDRDREAFFQAVMVLQRVPTAVGMSLYGSHYRSKDFFNRLHLYYGGSKDCDHWHQGAGFVTSHLAFTIQFELALQAVNPSVSVPYWDFTLESTFYQAGTWRNSPVFSPDWFGTAWPSNDIHSPTEGRFGYVPVMTGAQEFSNVYNSFGLLRAPWNNDPTPFMTRSGEVYGYHNNLKPSGCTEYSKALGKDNWMAMSRQLNSAAHGHLHELMGGSWEHYYSEYESFQTSPSILTFAHEIQALSKDLWREGFLLCPETCDLALVSAKDCKCQCRADVWDIGSKEVLYQAGTLGAITYFDSSGHLISEFLDEEGRPRYVLENYNEEESQRIYDSLLYLLCNPGHIGTMYQATSTNDITFWVLHPTLDRLWHWKRLADDPNYSETWDPYHTCYGHNPEDLQPFTKYLFMEEQEDGYVVDESKFYNNAELYIKLHPTNPTLTYVYDNFEWPHCNLNGYDMKNLS